MLLSNVQAQQIKPLNIGDTISGNIFNLITENSNNGLSATALNNKLIILDFMNTGCSSCIAALPRLDSLGQEFKKDLTVFVSTPESAVRVNNFTKHNAIAKGISISFITTDTLLERYFPHVYISHIVWINKGKIIAITHSDYVTDKHIKEVLSGVEIRWPVKSDVTNFDYHKSLLTINPETIPETSLPGKIEYTAFFPHLDNITPRFTMVYDSISNTTRVTAINYTLLQLCLKAFGLPPNYELSRVALAKVLEKYCHNTGKQTTNTDWQRQYTYCYETSIKGKLSNDMMQKKLQRDISAQYRLKAFVKDSVVNCWVLQYDSSKQEYPFERFPNYAAALKNNSTSVWSLVYKISHTFFHVPAVNRTSFGSQQYVKFQKVNLNDINAVNNAIAPYGLTFVQTEMKMPVLYLRSNQSLN